MDTLGEETPVKARGHSHHRTASSLGDFTMLEIALPEAPGDTVHVVKTTEAPDENTPIPLSTLCVMTETENLEGQASSGSLMRSLSEVDLQPAGRFKCIDWDGTKFYSDFIKDGLAYKKENPSVVMLFESPSSATSESSFHNKGKFKFHDWPPPKSTVSKAVLGPCRYALMNGASYPVFLRLGTPPAGLIDHWKVAVPGFVEGSFVPTIKDADTAYAYLPVEQIRQHVNPPDVHYHLAGKDAIHLMTQKTTKLLPDTQTSRPCVVKTTHSMGSKGIFIINDDEDEAEFEKFLEDSGNPTFVVTDFVDIDRNVACHFFMHPNGTITWFGSNENHREPDGKFSSDSYLLMEHQAKLKEMQLPFVEEVVQYCHSLGFWGFCGIDVLFDSKGNGYLVDINPRVTGSCPALMTLKQLKDKYGFEVGLFRRSGDINFFGTPEELMDKVTAYNTEHEGQSRIVIHSMYKPENKDVTRINIGVYGNSLGECKAVLNEYAKPPK